MSLHAALSASDRIAALDDGWDLADSRPVASTDLLPPARATPAEVLDDGWDLPAEEPAAPPALRLVPAPAACPEPSVIVAPELPVQEPPEPVAVAAPEPIVVAAPEPAVQAELPPAYAAVAFSTDELAFFDAGDDLAVARPAPVETFEDIPAPPKRGFWRRLLSR